MKKRKIVFLFWFSMLVSIIQPLAKVESFSAANDYGNAQVFYESTGLNGESYHAEAYNGKVYYATKGKLASSSSNTKYLSVGWDVMLSGNGHSVSFTIQKNDGSLVEVHQCQVNNYQYNLYCITEDRLYELASKADSYNASYVLGASRIDVRMDAIMTTKKGNNIHGGIVEDGYGGFTKWGTIYRLKNPADLNKMKQIFSGHLFESFTDVKSKIDNYLLNVRYAVNGTPGVSAGSSTRATVNSGYRLANRTLNGVTTPYVLHNSNGSMYTTSGRTLQKATLLNANAIGLSKTGYYLPSGKEWITIDYRNFASNGTYQTTTLEPVVGYKDSDLTLYANWKPHKYTIVYNANGGTGSMNPTSLYYDNYGSLSNNLFTRTGYQFKGWNTRADGKGTSYTNQAEVYNLMTTSGTITLYAQWKPCVYQITTDKQTGTGGTDTFWQKYATGFFSNAAVTNIISSITPPEKTGYDFTGYFSWIKGAGDPVVNSSGKIGVGNTYFIDDTTIYANWKPKTFIVTFDMQGGNNGSIFAIATYDSVYPMENIETSESVMPPVRDGYHFMGYYTEKGGKGTCIYNEFMATDEIYKKLTNETLYAYWIDDILPELTFTGNDTWTRDEVVLTADASDLGTGLNSIQIYQINADETETLVAEVKSLDGVKQRTLTFTNTTEGVVRYRAVATDMAGNSVESYATALYDITAPTGEIITSTINGTKFYFEIDITDINTGD